MTVEIINTPTVPYGCRTEPEVSIVYPDSVRWVEWTGDFSKVNPEDIIQTQTADGTISPPHRAGVLLSTGGHLSLEQVVRFYRIISVRKNTQIRQLEDFTRHVTAMLAQAAHLGIVLTVEQKPLLPLAMGNYETVVSIRPVRERGAP